MSPSRLVQDTDPLDFELIKEKFGITPNPPLTRIAHEFSTFLLSHMLRHKSTSLQTSSGYWKQKDSYALAMVQ